MSDDIDLEHGEPEPESPSARRRRERRGRSSDSSGSGRSGGGSGSSNRENTTLVGQLDQAFVKLADQLLARDDEELATAIREERHAMSQGLVSLTSAVPFLRPFLVLTVTLAEYGLAFWRVGRILTRRFLGWRERRIAENQQRQAEWEAAQQPGIPSVEVPVT